MSDDRGSMWLSTREGFRSGDPTWDDYIHFIGLPRLREVRSIDSALNPCAGGNYPVYSLDEVWERLEILSPPDPKRWEYYLLFMDALATLPLEHPRLRPLGYDLSDETWTSSLLNCSQWGGVLEPIGRAREGNGLLGRLEDAKLAQALLPEAWAGDPHSYVTVWALFEVTSGRKPDLAEQGTCA